MERSTHALQYWKTCNELINIISRFQFDKVARAVLSSLASYASDESLFSELERTEGNQLHSLLASLHVMSQVIRSFVTTELENARIPQRGLLYPEADSFKGTVCTAVKNILEELQ